MRRLLALLGVILTIFINVIPVRLAIASHIAPNPQAIFVLGGGLDREELAAQIAQYYPDLDIWISSGATLKESLHTFEISGIAAKRVHRDYSATDTVTNFTSLVNKFQQLHIHHVLLITSDFHMPRAKAIATLVLGVRGITFTPVYVPSNQPNESIFRIIRDSIRSLFWIFSGRTAASFNPNLNHSYYAFRPVQYRYI